MAEAIPKPTDEAGAAAGVAAGVATGLAGVAAAAGPPLLFVEFLFFFLISYLT